MSVTAALQAALAAEHAVIWGYGVVGAEVTAAQRLDVRAAEQAHRSRRDTTTDLLLSMAAVPTAAAAYYELPFPVTDPASGLRLAVHLEQGAAAAWRFVLAHTDEGALRRTALAGLTGAALQATRWRLAAGIQPATVTFPGQ